MKSTIVCGFAIIALLAGCGKDDKLSADNLKGSEWSLTCNEVAPVAGVRATEPALRSNRSSVAFTEKELTVKSTAFSQARCNSPAAEVAWTYEYAIQEKVSEEFEFGRKEQSEKLFPVKKLELKLKAATLSLTGAGQTYINHLVTKRTLAKPQLPCKEIALPVAPSAPLTLNVLALPQVRNHHEDYTKACEFAFVDGVAFSTSRTVESILFPGAEAATEPLTERPFYGYETNNTDKPLRAHVGAKSITTIQLAEREANLSSLHLMKPVAFDDELPPFAGHNGRTAPIVFSRTK